MPILPRHLDVDAMKLSDIKNMMVHVLNFFAYASWGLRQSEKHYQALKLDCTMGCSRQVQLFFDK